jgi:hypothetical protein
MSDFRRKKLLHVFNVFFGKYGAVCGHELILRDRHNVCPHVTCMGLCGHELILRERHNVCPHVTGMGLCEGHVCASVGDPTSGLI